MSDEKVWHSHFKVTLAWYYAKRFRITDAALLWTFTDAEPQTPFKSLLNPLPFISKIHDRKVERWKSCEWNIYRRFTEAE